MCIRDSAEAEDAAAAEKEAAGKGAAKGAEPAAKKSAKKDGGFMGNPAVKSFLRSAGTVLGREISRSLFGTRKRR